MESDTASDTQSDTAPAEAGAAATTPGLVTAVPGCVAGALIGALEHDLPAANAFHARRAGGSAGTIASPEAAWRVVGTRVLVPAHLFLFKGMTAASARRCRALQAPRGALPLT